MGRKFRFARLIGLATVWLGQTRADIALRQVDHKNRNRSDNSPNNLDFLDEVDDAGRSAGSQNTRAAWQLKPWREEMEGGKGHSCKVRKVNISDRTALGDWTEYPTAQKAAAATRIDESAFLKAILNDGFARAGGVGFELVYTCVLVEKDGEQWKASGRDGVEISDHGRLRVTLTKEDDSKLYLEKKSSVGDDGYRYLWMPLGDDDELCVHKKISHLVLERFGKGERRLGYEARHLNGECDDDRLVNLAWGTHAENQNDTAQSRSKGDTCSYAPCDEDGTITGPWTSCESQTKARGDTGVTVKKKGFAAALENETPLESPNGEFYRFRDDATPPPAERSAYECFYLHESHFHRQPPVGLIQQFTTTHNMFRKIGDNGENHTFFITHVENRYYDEDEDLSFRENTKEDDAIHYRRLTVHYKRAALRDPVLGLGWRIADADEEATAAYVHEMDDCYFFDADADTEDATSIAAQYEHQRTHGKKGKKRKAPAPAPAPRAPAPPAPPAAPFVMPGSNMIPPAPPAARFVMPGAHVIPTGPAPVPEWGPAPPPRRTARSTKQRDYADPSKTGFGLCVPPAPALPRRLSLREFPCPAGCGRTFTHAPAAANHGKTCRRPRAPKRQATPQVSAPAAFANGDPPPPPPAADDAQADEVVMTGVTPASNSTPAPMDDDDDDDGVPEIPGTTI